LKSLFFTVVANDQDMICCIWQRVKHVCFV